MNTKNLIAAAAIAIAAVGCGNPAPTDEVETRAVIEIPAQGPGSDTLWTHDSPYSHPEITVVPTCSTGDTTLYTAECPFEAPDNGFDVASGPGSNSLGVSE